VTNPSSTNGLNFPLHIYNSSIIEGIEMSIIIQSIKETGMFPLEKENTSTSITYTKNPHFSLIRKMKRQGMIL
jgi:hypothetical protein